MMKPSCNPKGVRNNARNRMFKPRMLVLALLAGANGHYVTEGAAVPGTGFLLVLKDDRANEVLASYPLEMSEHIIYRYNHSVENTVVEEGFELGDDGVLYLIFSRSPQHGLGHIPREGSLTVSQEKAGWQTARDLHIPITPFFMFTGEESTSGATLVWRGQQIRLSKLFRNRHVEWQIPAWGTRTQYRETP